MTTATTGSEPDLDGYTVQLDAESPRGIGSAATLRMEEVAAGPHTVQLAGIAANCTVSGDNPRILSLTAGETTSVTFAITCSATTGSLEVTSSTSGISPDADGYTITLDGVDRGPLGVSAAITLTGLTPGSHVVGLSGVAVNCGVQSENPSVVTITAGTSTAVAFSINCAGPPPQAGVLRISTVTDGPDQDADGYAVAVDGAAKQPIGVNSVISLANVAAGSHRVRLSEVASNCTLAGTNPRAVTVASGAVAELGFAVSCTGRTASASRSTVTASPSTINLLGTSTIMVTVRDGNGRTMSALPVTLSSSGTGNTISPASQPSNQDGQASFTYSSTVAEAKTITARAGAVELAQKALVTVEKVASTVVLTLGGSDHYTVNQTVRVTFFVSAGNFAPTGDVTLTVSDGPETCTATLVNQNGFCDIVLQASGTGPDHQRIFTATYSGDAQCARAIAAETRRVDPSIFEVVSVRDHIPGSFGHYSLSADRERIYLGSAQGSLFVLARDRAADFPLVQTIDIGVPISAVRGDAERLYVTTVDGLLRVYAKGSSLGLVRTRALSTYTYLGALEVFQDKLYVGVGFAQLAVDSDRLFLAQLNEGEVALEVDKATLEVTRTYGQTFVEGRTAVYDRLTGAVAATIPYPPVQLGPPAQPSLYLNGSRLMETNPGCCGWGITILQAPEFSESKFIDEPNTNTVVAVPNGFWSGMETGEIGFFDSQDHLVQKLNLRTLTGHTGSEDIEIRGLWADGIDDLVFAASSWGNDASRGPTLPSFFVLRLK